MLNGSEKKRFVSLDTSLFRCLVNYGEGVANNFSQALRDVMSLA